MAEKRLQSVCYDGIEVATYFQRFHVQRRREIMESRAKLFGHAIHPMLIVFPLGLLGTAAIFDALYLITSNSGLATASFWMIIAGIIGGLLAALFGFIDWFKIPSGTRAKSVGLYHSILNEITLILFAIGLYLRWSTPAIPPTIATICSFVGLGLALIGAWFGGELVERLGVSVSANANLNAPSSLTHERVNTGDVDVRQHTLHPTH
jgi:uncharacterized membrane protein